jgi:hypothetical protein
MSSARVNILTKADQIENKATPYYSKSIHHAITTDQVILSSLISIDSHIAYILYLSTQFYHPHAQLLTAPFSSLHLCTTYYYLPQIREYTSSPSLQAKSWSHSKHIDGTDYHHHSMLFAWPALNFPNKCQYKHSRLSDS